MAERENNQIKSREYLGKIPPINPSATAINKPNTAKRIVTLNILCSFKVAFTFGINKISQTIG